jgi:hypothetical protein
VSNDKYSVTQHHHTTIILSSVIVSYHHHYQHPSYNHAIIIPPSYYYSILPLHPTHYLTISLAISLTYAHDSMKPSKILIDISTYRRIKSQWSSITSKYSIDTSVKRIQSIYLPTYLPTYLPKDEQKSYIRGLPVKSSLSICRR